MTATYRQKCKECGTFFRPEHGQCKTCPKCKEKKNKDSNYKSYMKDKELKDKISSLGVKEYQMNKERIKVTKEKTILVNKYFGWNFKED